MNGELTKKVSFDFIRYANCWEDADILLEGLNPQAGSQILSIGSAGDNSFSLLVSNPDLVVAIDVNKTQLYLIELKKAAIKNLNHQELIEFLGFYPSSTREKLFKGLKNDLSDHTRNYWEAHLNQIRNGVITQGKFENYFHLFSNKILPWIHSEKTISRLFEIKSETEQKEFYLNHWNTWRWKLLFKIFFSKYIMGKYGRDPEFLKEVKLSVGDHIFQKAENHLQTTHAQHNFMLRYNLTGNFGQLLPHYLQPENLEKIKTNIHKLQIMEGYAEDAHAVFGKFQYMNLSDIFEYMNNDRFRKTAKQLVEATDSGGRLAYWNLMVPRKISEAVKDKSHYKEELSTRLSLKDKGFFYNRFIIDEIK
jgi:S-adenosylmethionine-diacylglycerol 3-amino-3-carboxypropyl transferase